MIDAVYALLSRIGYPHPLHPTLTHVPIGLVIGGLVFGVIGQILRRPSLMQSARHCIGLALITLPPTVLLGLMDWQHYYGLAWLFPIKMKLVLAGTLAVLLAVAVFSKKDTLPLKILIIYGVCFLNVVALGFFGGELVYGTKTTPGEAMNEMVQAGAVIFKQNCSVCHFTEKKETKVGPGLKGLFALESLPVSRRPVSEENIRTQLKTPYENMPPFKDFTEDRIEALTEYLKTL